MFKAVKSRGECFSGASPFPAVGGADNGNLRLCERVGNAS